MLPLFQGKCPCCDEIILSPISLIYSDEISENMSFNTFMKINSIFIYIQIYSLDYDLSDYDLCFIAYVSYKFDLINFKKYLESINYIFFDNELIGELYIELFSNHSEQFIEEVNSNKFKLNFFEKTCIKDNFKIFSILMFIRHKLNYLGEISKFDKCYTKVIKKYFRKAKLSLKKLKNLDINNSFYRIGEILFFLNLNVTRNFKPYNKENIKTCK